MSRIGRSRVVDGIRVAAVGAAGVMVISSAAWGQADDDALEAARACSSIESDAERLACLDDALGARAASDQRREPAVDSDEGADAVPAPAAQASGNQAQRSDAAEAALPREMTRRERRRAANAEPERTIRIVEVRRSGVGVLTFVADNGEAWVERSASAVRFPQVPFDAVLRPAMGDSYFLNSAAGSSRARVVPAR